MVERCKCWVRMCKTDGCYSLASPLSDYCKKCSENLNNTNNNQPTKPYKSKSNNDFIGASTLVHPLKDGGGKDKKADLDSQSHGKVTK